MQKYSASSVKTNLNTALVISFSKSDIFIIYIDKCKLFYFTKYTKSTSRRSSPTDAIIGHDGTYRQTTFAKII